MGKIKGVLGNPQIILIKELTLTRLPTTVFGRVEGSYWVISVLIFSEFCFSLFTSISDLRNVEN